MVVKYSSKEVGEKKNQHRMICYRMQSIIKIYQTHEILNVLLPLFLLKLHLNLAHSQVLPLLNTETEESAETEDGKYS